MKEFIGYSGGRTLYNEDLENLRDSVLSFSHLFEDCGFNFVISGCSAKASGSTLSISEGYVWLGGKIRKFSGSSFSSVPSKFYLIEKDSDGQSINFSTKNVSGFMSYNYEVTATITKPSSGEYIEYSDLQAKNLYSFFFHYALSKTTAVGESSLQTFNKEAGFTNSVAVNKYKITDNSGIYAIIYLGSGSILRIDLYDNYNKLCKSYTLNNGIQSYSSNGSAESLLNGGNIPSMQYLPTIRTGEAIVNAITGDIKADGKIVNVELFNKIDVSDWIPMFNGVDVLTGLLVKHIFNQVYISGTFPVLADSDIADNGSAGNHCYEYKTNIMLPGSIPLPSERTYFTLRCKSYASYNTAIICYFKSDKCLYFRSKDKRRRPESAIFVNWNYQY